MKRKDIEYEVRDKIFLKVSPWRKIIRFGKKGKSSPRFIGPYEILERIGPVAYRLAFPPELAKLHNVFYISMLWRYCFDESHILPVQDVQVQLDFTYNEEPKAILAREGTLATPRYGGSNLGTRINNEGIIPATLQFKY